MCGVPVPTGPFALLFFPIMFAGDALHKMNTNAKRIKYSIRLNNQQIDENVKRKSNQLKQDWKERVLYRKQYNAEKSLSEKMKLSDGMVVLDDKKDSDEQIPTQIISTDDAILYLQRSVVRISSNKLEKALCDIKLAIYLDFTLKDTYVVQYFEGFILYMLGDYLESAHAFKRAIELKEVQDEKSIIVETKVFEIQNAMKHTSEKVVENLTEFHEQTKTYFKSAHKKLLGKFGVNSQHEKKEKNESNSGKPSMISLEELYFRAGLAYYFSTYYKDSANYYSKAIEIGENNPNVYHYIFNRGLSYFYSNEMDLALHDFLKTQSLKETDEVDKMIAYVYGRKGMEKEKAEYVRKAQQINPKTILVSCFIYRLLDENTTNLIFSFLPIHNRVLLSRTGKYWRELVMRSIANEEVFKISPSTFFNNIESHLKKANTINTTLKDKLFMPPQNKVYIMDLFDRALSSSVYQYLLEKPAKKIDCYTITRAQNYLQFFTFCSNGLAFLKQVECLNIAQNSLTYEVIQVLTYNSPNLKELTIRLGSYVANITVFSAIPNFRNLKKLAWHYHFSVSDSPNIGTELVFPPSLEVFEYAIESQSLIEQELVPLYPNIQFIPIENTLEIAKKYCEIYQEVM